MPVTPSEVVERRTITTEGTFDSIRRFLSADNPPEDVHRYMTYENRIHDPRCDPVLNEYETDGPHEFRLKKRKTTIVKEISPMAQSASVEGEEQVVEELVLDLSDSVHEMYAGWTMTWKFDINGYYDDDTERSVADTPEGSRIINQPVIRPYSDPAEWKTIVVANATELYNLLVGLPDHDPEMKFKVTWSRQEPSFSRLDRTQRELDNLKRAIALTHTILLETFKRPSIDITRFSFRSKRSGTVQHLYVPSRVLAQFEYFQKCHSPEYSEGQHMDTSPLETKEIGSLDEGICCDDSDEEWDSDSEDLEPDKSATFKATICITGTSRRTYQAFIHYALCGALYFAPLRSAYQQYCKTPPIPASEIGQLQHLTPWPEWAEAHCTPHTVVAGFKTLTSPKSLYRLADMLIIPKLKSICCKQIISSLNVGNVISEIQTSIFQQHEELRVEAYRFMQRTWRLYERSQIVPFLTNMSQAEADLVFKHILKDLPA